MTITVNRRGAFDAVGADVSRTRRRPVGAGRARRRPVALTAALMVALSLALLLVGDRFDLDNAMMLYVLAVVVVAVTAGRVAALVAAVGSFVAEVYLFAPSRLQWNLFDPDHLVELTVFVAVAVLVSLVADAASTHRTAAHRHQQDALLLAELAAIRTGSTATTVLTLVRSRLGLSWMRLVRSRGDEPDHVLAEVGDRRVGSLSVTVDAGQDLRVEAGWEPPLPTRDERVVQAVADTVTQVWREQQLSEELARTRHLAEIDRVRSRLLAAVSHDLRTPLAGIKANASALRQGGASWPQEVHAELLTSIEESADQLTDLVTNLLAMSRIQAGAVSAHLAPVPLYEVVGRALVTIGDHDATLEVPEDLPLVLADQALLERVVANLVTNAHVHAAGGLPIAVRAATTDGGVRLSVVDHGPGVAEDRWEEVFQPFQRFDDSGTGLGLGLAIARGFSDAMGCPLLPSRTPGGGLTMSLVLRCAP